MALGVSLGAFSPGAAVPEFCRECQALISSCVWLILLQGMTGMSMVLLVGEYCWQIRDEAAALSLERDRNHGWVLLAAATSESRCCRSELWGIALAELGCVCVTGDRGHGTGLSLSPQSVHSLWSSRGFGCSAAPLLPWLWGLPQLSPGPGTVREQNSALGCV